MNKNEELSSKSLIQFSEVLASDSPVPGGGGASAYIGALASSLGSMVCSLTINKPKYADVFSEIQQASNKLTDLRNEMILLISEDANAFLEMSKVYSMPKDSPNREIEMEKALKSSVEPPRKILIKASEVIDILEILFDKGSKIMISDVGTGACAALAALEGASLNIFVNTGLMKDEDFAIKVNKETDQILQKYRFKAETIIENTKSFIRKGR